MIDPSDAVPLGHDGYLKMWALSKPRIAADFLLVDEAQDTNLVVLGALREQESQVIYVGDRHQQIYEWRGAVNAMERVNTPLSSYLTRSFRFGPEIAEAATKILATLGENRAIEGNPEKKSYIGCMNPNAILCRTNAQVIGNVIERQGNGQKVHIIGGIGELIRLLDGVVRLQRGEPSDVPEFFGFKSWREVVEFSSTSEGRHLQTFVKLVDYNGEVKLQQALRNTESREEDANVVVSTAHKSKGREWDDVALSGDFASRRFDKGGRELPLDESEVRLFYVAATRGKVAVDIAPELCAQFEIKFNPKPETPKPLLRPAPVAKTAQEPSFREILRMALKKLF